MTAAQAKRVEQFKRRVSVKGAVPDSVSERVHRGRFYNTEGAVIIGWERSRDGRDMTTLIDPNGRTIYTETTYRYH